MFRGALALVCAVGCSKSSTSNPPAPDVEPTVVTEQEPVASRSPVEVAFVLALSTDVPVSDDVLLERHRLVADDEYMVICRRYSVGERPGGQRVSPEEARVLLGIESPKLGQPIELRWRHLRLAEAMVRMLDPGARVIERAAAFTGTSAREVRAQLAAVGFDVDERAIQGVALGAKREGGGFSVEVVADSLKAPHNVSRTEAGWLAPKLSLGDRFSVPRAWTVLEPWAKNTPAVAPMASVTGAVWGDAGAFETLRTLLPPIETPAGLAGYQLGPLRRMHSVDHGALYAEIPVARAWKLWTRLDADAAKTGYRPLLLGDPDGRRGAQLAWESGGGPVYGDYSQANPADVLAQAARVDVNKRLRLKGNPAYPDWAPERGPWPSSERPSTRLVVFADFRGRVYKNVWLVLIPTDEAYKTAAWMPSLNSSGEATPSMAEVVAVSKHWQDKYGARIAVIEPAVVEWVVPAHKLKRRALLELAAEHFYFAPEGGSSNLEIRAAGLDGATTWYAWWD